MILNYHVFAYDDYCASGGANDHVGSGESLTDCINIIRALNRTWERRENYHIVDIDMKRVAEGSCESLGGLVNLFGA